MVYNTATPAVAVAAGSTSIGLVIVPTTVPRAPAPYILEPPNPKGKRKAAVAANSCKGTRFHSDRPPRDRLFPSRKTRDINEIDVADVLSIYRDDARDRQASPTKFDARILGLNEFFGGTMLGGMNTQLCKDYAKERGSGGGARRDLEDLRAAIGHHAKENLHHAVVSVWLPPKGTAG